MVADSDERAPKGVVPGRDALVHAEHDGPRALAGQHDCGTTLVQVHVEVRPVVSGEGDLPKLPPGVSGAYAVHGVESVFG